MHGGVIVDKGQIAILPGNIKGHFVGQRTGFGNIGRVQRGVITEGNGFTGIITGVLPAIESGNELIEETAPTITQIPYCGKDGRGRAQVSIVLPLP